ncbi:aflatoxin regulatory protein-domain-containing protein [Aspergillus karnatakaensis]|uniref:Zn(II)2Cys6 transcription factor n=1 Tax=Aspergillus karnatakaensis TaxID=1810916 RepID=UPI003CCCC790
MTEPVGAESVSSLSNTSRPTSGQHSRKLRDSCTNCANSKVRCNKEKPVCGRCVRRRLSCEYEVSRRTGRTSRSANHLLTATSSMSTASPVPSTLQATSLSMSPDTQVVSAPFASNILPHGMPVTPSTVPPISFCAPDHSMIATSDLWGPLVSPTALNNDISSLMSLTADVSDMFASVTEPPRFDHCDVETLSAPGLSGSISATEHSLLPTPASSDSRSMGSWDNMFNPAACCLSTALSILANLFSTASTTCDYPQSQQQPCVSRTLESIISENRQIIDSINQILDCTCSSDPYIISIVSLAVFKVMGWYIAAARSRTPGLEDGMEGKTTSSIHPSEGECTSFIAHDLHPSALAESYYTPDRNWSRMAAQLVLGELHRVQRLVNVLASRLGSIQLRGTNRISGSNSARDAMEDSLVVAAHSSPLSNSTFSNLEDDLRKRLRAISAETIEMLRRA